MTRLNKEALAVFGRIYTHQRFYFVGEYKGFYRDSHKRDEPLKPIPPNEWQALCNVINNGHSALKANINYEVDGEIYMQALAQKGRDNHVTPVPFTKEELLVIKRAHKGIYFITPNDNPAAGMYYIIGEREITFLNIPFNVVPDGMLEGLKILKEKGLLSTDEPSPFDEESSISEVTVLI